MITELKKSGFKTSYIKVLIKRLFEFDCFFKLQNVVKSRIHFNTRCERGAYNRLYFFWLQVDGPIKWGGRLISGGGINERNTHTPIHGLASTSNMHTAMSPGQWQPWTAVSPLLGLISVALPLGQPVSSRPFSA